VVYDHCATQRDSVRLLGCPPNFAFTLTLPDVFSPNGDGLNEAFGPMVVENLRLTRLRVYDRWGRLVYQQRGPTLRWTGTLANGPAPEGIYFYVIDFTRPVTNIPDQRRGTVVLLR
jgi:gliding motility-associated-like protein